MNKKLVLFNILMIAGLLLAACGPDPSTITIQIPGADGSTQPPAQGAPTNMLVIYILMGALVLITLVALLGKRGSQ